MIMSVDVTFDIVTASICAALILVRCGYRIFSRCRVHDSCHRTWHADDAYMAFAIVPLIGRTTCIAISFVLNPTHTFGLPTPEDAAAQGVSIAQLEENYVASRKLLIPSRIFYAMFLWSLKLCLLNFYSRFVDVFHWGKVATTALWWFIVVTFFIVLIPTLAECRPLSLKAQLILLFSIAGLIVVITIMRLPMILNQAVSQRSRSMWASIEILCACIVANTAFFYALLKDYQRGHDSRVTGSSSYARQPDFYMQAIPSPELRRGSEPSDRLDTADCWRRESRSSRSTIANLSNWSFGAMCILSALPFVGIPFPNQRAADYYAGKNRWISELSGGRLDSTQAGYAGAVLRIAVGTAVLVPATREAALLINGAIVTRGTMLAVRDGKPLLPQWGMLGIVAWCLVLGRVAR
ncbi:hypothetical protein CCHR01_02562 [Colletotrichum chrysophilum]|uniref:Rhodopsin domain-containing protein n=1 Tax=Colletotrichum chrysophilum TaxID=1836956 RepID=A0AAD9AUE7_9PEZI|nr:hypothetical protein CCHR01_02562 [Colletotrichum chrysophilum]